MTLFVFLKKMANDLTLALNYYAAYNVVCNLNIGYVILIVLINRFFNGMLVKRCDSER